MSLLFNKISILLASALLASGCTVTPEPLTRTDLQDKSASRLAHFAAGQEEITQPITLYEAMARALKYNLDYKVELMEVALRSRELELARFEQLPQLVANANYQGRDNYSGASSSRLIGKRSVGDQSLVSSTSSERETHNTDLSISWDLLDFGLSYVRAKQKADEVLIAQENRRKIINRIVEDVRTAYWRAVSAERLMNKLHTLENDIQRALRSSRQVYQRRNTEPLTALTYQRELLAIQEEIQNLQRSLSSAKLQLGALMNVPPGQPFKLVLPKRSDAYINYPVKPDEMVRMAMTNRPELREISYRQRINEQEADAALLELLPNLKLFGGFNYDSNDYLYNSHWANWGASASWNLIKLFRYPSRKLTVEAQQALFDQRALALTMAVITQVHVSRTRFEQARRRVFTMREYKKVQSEILKHIRAGFKAERISEQTHIRERMNHILAEAKLDIALADLQNAYANIFAATGIDPFGHDINGQEDIDDLARKLKRHWQRPFLRVDTAQLTDMTLAQR